MAGVGLLCAPADDSNDVWFGHESLTQTDHAAMMRRLDGLGWRLAEDGDGIPWVHVGTLDDGRDVLLLAADDPLISNLSPDEIASAVDELHREAGLQA